ncbi:hypothetical protein [Saccharopolyspora hordei]|uniref:Tetratricopeptide (TPR) repeat protein n=3 Tax=Saccharopolyspora hordei TaxID=1838 RepID=A0A853AU55_9PSEU|nr:hypothetical protein [Saccharopolyspora hordei]NYI86180.1 tetratricopeptide (TPR) repeat protein [Saccharopolyspora hordei]
MLSDRAVALARRTGDASARLRAEALAVFASNRLGWGVPVTGRALAAVRDAESAGDAEVTAELRVELAWCACAAGSPEVAARILQPVLEQERIDSGLRAHALLALAASMPVREQGGVRADALDEAERLYGSGESNPDTARMHRARVCAARAGHHRRLGQFDEATAVADAGLELLHQLGDPAADSGEVRTRLVLERVQSLLELGHRSEAIQAAERVLAEPVRAAAAGPVGWLGLALATRVHLPNGDHAAALRVLADTAAISERHKLDGLLAEALSTLSQVHERGTEFAEALRALRGAYAADRRWRAAVHHARVRLLAEYPELGAGTERPRRRRRAQAEPADVVPSGPRNEHQDTAVFPKVDADREPSSDTEVVAVRAIGSVPGEAAAASEARTPSTDDGAESVARSASAEAWRTAVPPQEEATAHELVAHAARDGDTHDASPHGGAAHEVAARETAGGGAEPHEVAAHGTAGGEAAAHDLAAREGAADGVAAEEPAARDAAAYGAHDATAHETATHGSAAREVSAHEVGARERATHGPAEPEPAAHGSAERRSAAHETTARDRGAHGAADHEDAAAGARSPDAPARGTVSSYAEAADAARRLMEQLTSRAAELRGERRRRADRASGASTPDEPEPAHRESQVAGAEPSESTVGVRQAGASGGSGSDRSEPAEESSGQSERWPTELWEQSGSSEDTVPELPVASSDAPSAWQDTADPVDSAPAAPESSASEDLPAVETTAVLPAVGSELGEAPRPDDAVAPPRHGASEQADTEDPDREAAQHSSDGAEAERGGRRSRGRSLAEIRASLQLPEQPRSGRRRARHAEPEEPEPADPEPAAETVARHREPDQDGTARSAPPPPSADSEQDTHPNLPVTEPEDPERAGVTDREPSAEQVARHRRPVRPVGAVTSELLAASGDPAPGEGEGRDATSLVAGLEAPDDPEPAADTTARHRQPDEAAGATWPDAPSSEAELGDDQGTHADVPAGPVGPAASAPAAGSARHREPDRDGTAQAYPLGLSSEQDDAGQGLVGGGPEEPVERAPVGTDSAVEPGARHREPDQPGTSWPDLLGPSSAFELNEQADADASEPTGSAPVVSAVARHRHPDQDESAQSDPLAPSEPALEGQDDRATGRSLPAVESEAPAEPGSAGSRHRHPDQDVRTALSDLLAAVSQSTQGDRAERSTRRRRRAEPEGAAEPEPAAELLARHRQPERAEAAPSDPAPEPVSDQRADHDTQPNSLVTGWEASVDAGPAEEPAASSWEATQFEQADEDTQPNHPVEAAEAAGSDPVASSSEFAQVERGEEDIEPDLPVAGSGVSSEVGSTGLGSAESAGSASARHRQPEPVGITVSDPVASVSASAQAEWGVEDIEPDLPVAGSGVSSEVGSTGLGSVGSEQAEETRHRQPEPLGTAESDPVASVSASAQAEWGVEDIEPDLPVAGSGVSSEVGSTGLGSVGSEQAEETRHRQPEPLGTAESDPVASSSEFAQAEWGVEDIEPDLPVAGSGVSSEVGSTGLGSAGSAGSASAWHRQPEPVGTAGSDLEASSSASAQAEWGVEDIEPDLPVAGSGVSSELEPTGLDPAESARAVDARDRQSQDVGTAGSGLGSSVSASAQAERGDEDTQPNLPVAESEAPPGLELGGLDAAGSGRAAEARHRQPETAESGLLAPSSALGEQPEQDPQPDLADPEPEAPAEPASELAARHREPDQDLGAADPDPASSEVEPDDEDTRPTLVVVEQEASAGPRPAAELIARHRQPDQDGPAESDLPAPRSESAQVEPDDEDTRPTLVVAEQQAPAEQDSLENASLAELLTEALLAYETGRRDQAASTSRHGDVRVSGITSSHRSSRVAVSSTSDDRGSGAAARHRRSGMDAAATDPLV